MQFPLKFDGEFRTVRKLRADEWGKAHAECIAECAYEDRCLILPESGWTSLFLGAGEEKAVICICDADGRVFALEMLDERTYLNGRFVGGTYFAKTRARNLTNVRLNPKSQFGLKFTGKVLGREFVYGYEWSRFQFHPGRTGPVDAILTGWLQGALRAQFQHFRANYKDVHDRNVMFEIRPIGAKGVPIVMRNWHGKMRMARIGLQAIDVR